MKLPNYTNISKNKIETKKEKTEIKTVAEYVYIKKEQNGKVQEKKFVSTMVSTIDVPYGKYILR